MRIKIPFNIWSEERFFAKLKPDGRITVPWEIVWALEIKPGHMLRVWLYPEDQEWLNRPSSVLCVALKESGKMGFDNLDTATYNATSAGSAVTGSARALRFRRVRIPVGAPHIWSLIGTVLTAEVDFLITKSAPPSWRGRKIWSKWKPESKKGLRGHETKRRWNQR